jgi:predicted  nucleic acid-binding Zn-ribbon protein
MRAWRGGTYPYFICSGRQAKRTDCKQRAMRIEKVEEAVAAFYATVQLNEDELVAVRPFSKKSCPSCASIVSANARPRRAD